MSVMRREEDEIIALVPTGSKVLDLGCGDGKLLARLRDERDCVVRGVEIDQKSLIAAVGEGVPVIQVDLNNGLDMYLDNSFDFVILSQTLKEIEKPAQVLSEIMRVGKRAIVSFPNFAHWSNRYQLFFGGTMPVSKNLPMSWYETTSIHHTTIPDFKELIDRLGGTIENLYYLQATSSGRERVIHQVPQWRAETVIAIISRGLA